MKIKNDDLLQRIEENILVTGELIKSCGYLSLQKGYERPLVNEFFDAHTNALINSKNNGKEISDIDFPRKEYICNLPKGNYLIGDFSQCLIHADKILIREFQESNNMDDDDIIFPDEIIPFSEKRYLSIKGSKNSDFKKSKFFSGGYKTESLDKFGNNRISFDSNNNKFLYVYLCEDEGDIIDVLDNYYFQNSMAFGCFKVSEDFFSKHPEILNSSGWEAGHCYSFSEDFKCTYFEDYEILQLGNFFIWKPEGECIN